MAGGTQRQSVTTGNGVLFEVVFKNADPRKKPTSGISLSYGGQVYRCNDAASMGSVHTIYTDDEEGADSSKSHCQGKTRSQGSARRPETPSTCLKKSPRKSVLQSAPLLKPSPKKLKRRSRTLSPSRTRSLLAPLSNLSRKLSMRRHSYDEDAKTKPEKSQVREDKAESPPDRRRILRNVPYTIQAPPRFAHHNQFPMYQYVPTPQYQPAFGTARMAYPIAQGAATNTAPQLPPELQQLQGCINHVTAVLAANPIDLHAKRELDRLMAERNSFLDSATKRAVPAATPGPIELPKPKPDEVRRESSPVDKPNSAKLQKNEPESIEPTVAPERRHICSGCGEARSPSFHRKHPFAKPVHNVCRKCREGRRARSVMSRYHFCDGCGIVRSKEYHRRRGSAASVSARSKICRKCHASGNYTMNKASQDKGQADERKQGGAAERKSSSRDVPRRESVIVEPRGLRPSHRQNGSADDTDISGYDGATDLTSSALKTPPQNSHLPVKGSAFTNYRSPQISDEDASSNQPASLESSFHSSGPDSPLFREHAAPESRSAEAYFPDDAASKASEPSLTAPENTASSANNPYYQPRSRLSSPFHYTEASSPRQPCPPVEHHASSPGVSPEPPRFVDRNQSWPGDLDRPAFLSGSTTTRKVSASEGAASPTAPDGERFTTGAFAKTPSSFKPSSPPSSPWASFSGPIPNPASEPGGGSKGAYHHEPSAAAGGGASSTGSASSTLRESVFDSYNPPPPASPPFRFGRRPTSYSRRRDDSGEFASTRGAWNNISTGAFARATDNPVPEPIIEEPSSPAAKSPTSTPLLLEFHDLSDSGVEFLTGSASPSSACSSEESLLGSHNR